MKWVSQDVEPEKMALISDSIEKIFKDRLKTEKKLDIEQSANRYNFIGNEVKSKPFYMLNLLSKQGVPQDSKRRNNRT
ncbi:MAG: hypothetical protein CM15mP110_3490 [Alphaproteobacteria bacterium]|nr:MAG: hypothetical protein CM15mP110_3490 [Alphaproteobacteria bacterium]